MRWLAHVPPWLSLRSAWHGRITLLYWQCVCTSVLRFVTAELVFLGEGISTNTSTGCAGGVLDGWKYYFHLKHTRLALSLVHIIYTHPTFLRLRLNHPGLFTDHDPTHGSGQEVFKFSRVESGRFSVQNLAGRVGSGQEVFK